MGFQCEKSFLFLAFPPDKRKYTVKKWAFTPLSRGLTDNETEMENRDSLWETGRQKHAGTASCAQSTHMQTVRMQARVTFQFQIHV